MTGLRARILKTIKRFRVHGRSKLDSKGLKLSFITYLHVKKQAILIMILIPEVSGY